MYVSAPVLAAIAIAFLILLSLALRRRGGDRDLIAPPSSAAERSSAPATACSVPLPPGIEA